MSDASSEISSFDSSHYWSLENQRRTSVYDVFTESITLLSGKKATECTIIRNIQQGADTAICKGQNKGTYIRETQGLITGEWREVN